MGQQLIIMHHTMIEANVPLSEAVCILEMEAGVHSLEEGDQLIPLMQCARAQMLPWICFL